jgi:hypothetical protein
MLSTFQRHVKKGKQLNEQMFEQVPLLRRAIPPRPADTWLPSPISVIEGIAGDMSEAASRGLAHVSSSVI